MKKRDSSERIIQSEIDVFFFIVPSNANTVESLITDES